MVTDFAARRADPANRRSLRLVLLASSIGSIIEWYDFFLYSTALALVLGPLFFPARSAAAGVLASFATYAAGFVARPVGGVLIGHFGDRVGRKSMLMFTLMVMGVATFGVGLLPTYHQAGVLAPVLLVTLRVLQGIGIGGEWGGSVLMSGEHAPTRRRGVLTSFQAAGFPLGLFASTLVFHLIGGMPRTALLDWGWRIPFLASILLVAVGAVVRRRVAESPDFLRMRSAGQRVSVPIAEVLRRRPVAVLRGLLTAVGLATVVSVYTVYLLSYASSGPNSGHAGQVLTGLLLGALAEAAMLPVFGALSDRRRRPVLVFGFAVCAAVIVPAPAWLTSGDGRLAALSFVLALGVGHAAIYGAFSAYLVNMFPVRLRYSAVAVTYQLATTIASFSPLVAAALAGSRHTAMPAVWILLGTLVLGALAVLTDRRQATVD